LAIRNKLEVVAEDPFERTGWRALLNFGHTVGHALETISGFSARHGDCVSIGMVAEARIAAAEHLISDEVIQRIEACLTSFGLPTALPSVGLDELIDVMHHDKKVSGGTIRMIMLTGIGMAEIRSVPDDVVRAALSGVPHVQT
jgi:3-dehydroquinate synthase